MSLYSALILELVRRYWLLGIECSILEIQKLAWFLVRVIESQDIENPLQLKFTANNYGPYANRLRHVLDALDGSYLESTKRISDSGPLDVVHFNYSKKNILHAFLNDQAVLYLPALEQTSKLIEGFESPYGLELLSTVDWLIHKAHCAANVSGILTGIRHWPAGEQWAQRKEKIFDIRAIEIALCRLKAFDI